jgi:hypothetical protein
MSARVSVTVEKAGVVAVKTATTPQEQNDLAIEAERLSQAAHPGVVTLVEHRIAGERAELHTLFAGEPVSHWRGTVPRAAGLVAAVAATLADLHDLGVVHGRLDETHVLLAADGRPRLCGFSPPDPDASPVDDVGGLGQLLAALLGRATAADRRGSFRWPRAAVAERRALASLVAHATDPLVERRPTARAFARSILATIPGAELAPTGSASAAASSGQAFQVRLPPRAPTEPVDAVFGDQTTAPVDDVFVDRPWPEARSGGGRPARPTAAAGHRHHAAAFKLFLVVLVVGAGGGLLLRAGGTPSDAGAPTKPVASSPVTELSCAPAPPPVADVDGDGCPESVSVLDGMVQAGGQAWTVGAPDDALAVGDWDCDGLATPALYRPTTGDVFVFSGWAPAGQSLTEEAVTRVAGGVALTADPLPGGSATCDQLSVELATGGRYVVEVN